MIQSKFGVGLRPTHYSDILNVINGRSTTSVEWFEALSENHMQSEGRPLEMLLQVRSCFPVALHGVGLSVGSHDGIDLNYLAELKKLINKTDPFLVSDHLCWTGVPGRPTHDLLPLPYTAEAVGIVSRNIDFVQTELARPIAIENVSSYLSFDHSEMTEWEFIKSIQQKTGCFLLLDINNVYVNSFNHKFDGKDFIDGLPLESVKQIHLAGHTHTGEFLFDTHSAPVADEVWQLYQHYKTNAPETPAVLIEWDDDIPSWEVLQKESEKAREKWLAE